LSHPTVFACGKLEDSGVPYAVDGLRRLGTVRDRRPTGRLNRPAATPGLSGGRDGVGGG
jgi:hypothetical protein